MARLLKQSTAITFRIGPFLDSSDGVTPETGLTIAQADIQISKAGGAFAQTSASPTTTHDADGWYQCPLTATDTNTLGMLTVQIAMAGALPVWEHFMVVPANVYDSLVAGSDALQVDTTQIEGADATDQIRDAVVDDATRIDASALNTAAAAVGSDGSGLTEAGGTGDHLSALATAAALAVVDQNVDDIETAVGALNDPSASEIADAVWDEATADHVGSGSFGEEMQAHALSTEISALNDPSAGDVADAVWDEAQAGHVGAGSFGEIATEIAAILVDTGTTLQAELDGIQADTENIQSRLPASLSNGAIDANVVRINDAAVEGDGTSGTEWGPA